jgi:DNA-binding Lrp family transcriptional regulator
MMLSILLSSVASEPDEVSTMPDGPLDRTDAALLSALADDPRATVLALALSARLSRNTVQARIERYEARGVLGSFERRIEPAALGYPLTSYISITVTQSQLDEVATALAAIPEVCEVIGLSGVIDFLVRVVSRDADDLYRVAGMILATEGVRRTETSLVMRQLLAPRIRPLLERLGST